MYWPIGAPRIYAACNSKAPKDRVHQFDDKTELENDAEGSSYINATSATHDAPEDEGLLGTEHLTSTTPHTPAIRPVEHHASQRKLSSRALNQMRDEDEAAIRHAEKQPILMLRISRTGHLFAVITDTSMTVWQTKV